MKFEPKQILLAVVLCAATGAGAFAAQDRSTLRVPDGLGFADFKGYESWETISVHHTDKLVKMIAGNPAMIRAYKEGFPANGKPAPDGAKIVKYEWQKADQADLPGSATVADKLERIEFMFKDSKRFADSAGWGFANFENDIPSGTLRPDGTGHMCGTACHQAAASKDRVFTTYAPR